MTVPAFTISSGIGPLPRLLEAAGGSRLVTRVFQDESLPLSVAAGEANWIPLRSLLSLFERSAAAAGDDLFGLHVGQAMQPEDFGLWARYAMAAANLKGMIARLVRAVAYHQSGGAFGLEVSDEVARWSYRVTEPVVSGRRHHADHALWPMLLALRRCADGNWTPVHVECSYDRPPCWRQLEEAFGAPVHFGKPANTIVFDRRLLEAPLRHKIQLDACVTYGDLRRLVAQRPPDTIHDAVRAIVRTRVREPQTDLDGTASLLGVSARTLQRQLREENVTFREVLDQVRMERAFELIQDTTSSITEIAFALGYDDPTSFSRAFRRLMGCSPAQVKRSRTPAAKGD